MNSNNGRIREEFQCLEDYIQNFNVWNDFMQN